MYYVMLEFRFLYVGLRKTIKDIFKLVGRKKIGREKTGKNHVPEVLNVHVNENNLKKSTFFRRIFFQAVKN